MAGSRVSVSVIIPCYNSKETIERAIQSVAVQTALPVEVILVDDCSTDGTLEMLHRLAMDYPKGWIHVVALPQNQGAANARNAGWEVASGHYIAFLDSDDTWHPQKIEIQHDWMERNSEIALTGHLMAQLDDGVHKPPPTMHQIGSVDFSPVSRHQLLLKNRFSTPTVMLRRSLQTRFAEGKRYSEDYLLWLTLACSGEKMAHCHLPLAYMYKAPFGASGLSARLWEMEKGELNTYYSIWKSKGITLPSYLALQIYSFTRYIRRTFHQ